MSTATTSKEQARENVIKRCRENDIVIPTFEQLRNPEQIPEDIKEKLKDIDMQEVHPLNLFRINWHNDPETGGFGDVNRFEIPRELTGLDTRIVGIVGKHFPIGAHKVGAAFGCLVPRLVNGQFDPDNQKAIWPSTGNYCRGGAFDSTLLACTPVAIMPEGMSQERFDWLNEIGAEVIKTPGTEANVKEIYDKCNELQDDPNENVVIFNQFDEFGNSCWHYNTTGPALEEVFQDIRKSDQQLSAWCAGTGSAGTIAAGDYLKEQHPNMKIVAAEAKQVPTMLRSGFGEHRIEGIGDKHIPWIHNVRNTDTVTGIDDEACMRLLRLFNEPAGHEFLIEQGVPEKDVKRLPLLGISCIANVLSAVKTAKYYEMDERDVVVTVYTDSSELYQSRLKELREKYGEYSKEEARVDWERYLLGESKEEVLDCGYYDKKRIHNQKYFTWVEQQGKSADELRELWDPDFWDRTYSQIDRWDEQIEELNKEAGVI
ncbi:MAG: pyridoxal-phosphate dependent enzyme [bacterium]